MGFFKQVKLENFRNFDQYKINLDKNCNILFGNNGSGKTNILESISLFEKGNGFRKDKINNLVNYKSKINIFKILGSFINNHNEINLLLFNQINNNKTKKILSVNNSTSRDSIKYFEDMFSIISFLPEMERLFLTSPSIRRNFLDQLIYGVDKSYLKTLSEYKKKVFERYNILKNKIFDKEWIKKIENDIVDLGILIYMQRYNHLKKLNSFLKFSQKLNKTLYQIELKISDKLFNDLEEPNDKLKDIFLNELKKSRNFDLIVGGSRVGPHKSDIMGINLLSNLNINQFSTGQQKTVVLLIIIAQCKCLLKAMNKNPIILFDEVCSHLDNDNRSLLLEIIESLNVQTIMTGTEEKFFSFLSTKGTYFNIDKS